MTAGRTTESGTDRLTARPTGEAPCRDDPYVIYDRIRAGHGTLVPMLLERRDRERGLSRRGLSRTEKTLLLQDIAYWLLRNG